MQNRICRYLRHPSEAYRVPMHHQPHEPAQSRMDETTIDLCTWGTGMNAPPAVARMIGGGVVLNDRDCDVCPCFAPIGDWQRKITK